ncbi:MAG: hypothetical protein RR359_04080 [Bacilli bacterium]
MEIINFNSSKEFLQCPYYTEGYESSLFKYKSKYVIKMFKSNVLKYLTNKQDKIILLHATDYPFISKPLATVTIENKFKGYLMNFINGEVLSDYSDHITKDELIDIFICLLEKINTLHQGKIYLGDIKPDNFIVSNGNIHIIDCDNFSIDSLENNYLSKYQTLLPKYKKVSPVNLDIMFLLMMYAELKQNGHYNRYNPKPIPHYLDTAIISNDLKNKLLFWAMNPNLILTDDIKQTLEKEKKII